MTDGTRCIGDVRIDASKGRTRGMLPFPPRELSLRLLSLRKHTRATYPHNRTANWFVLSDSRTCCDVEGLAKATLPH